MPGSPRAAQVDLATTPYYHCIARCVRRAFLCGNDPYTGQSFEHRKTWLLERLQFVASVFAIDVCAFAVLSNHFHLVLRVDADAADELTDEAVLRRYGRLFKNAAADVRALPAPVRAERIQVLRERLADISWFMRSVNEFVARRANKEDNVTGRFWEGRFKSQALLDERAVLTCMSYVDLNPVRAGLADNLEASEFTSIKQRLEQAAKKTDSKDAVVVALAPLRAEPRRRSGAALPMRYDDYLALLDWTGRAATAKSGGVIRGEPPEILRQLRIDASAWLGAMKVRGLESAATLGDRESMAAEAKRRGKAWLRGKRIACGLFATATG